jgi:hypothetical protein
MNWKDSQPGHSEIGMFLTRWIRPKGLCGIEGHLAVHMFPGQRRRTTIYGALNGVSAEVQEEPLTDRVDIKTPNFIEKPPTLRHHSVAKSQISEEVMVTFRISSLSRPQGLRSRSAFRVLAKQF